MGLGWDISPYSHIQVSRYSLPPGLGAFTAMQSILAVSDVSPTRHHSVVLPSAPSSSPTRRLRRAHPDSPKNSLRTASSPYSKEQRPAQYSPKARRPGTLSLAIPHDFAVRLFDAISHVERRWSARKGSDGAEADDRAGVSAGGSLHSDGADTVSTFCASCAMTSLTHLQTLVADIPDSSSVETVVPSPRSNGERVKQSETSMKVQVFLLLSHPLY